MHDGQYALGIVCQNHVDAAMQKVGRLGKIAAMARARSAKNLT